MACALTLGSLGCHGPAPRFPLKAPLEIDPDHAPVSVRCRPGKEADEPPACMPEEYVSSFAWDAADNMVFRPVAKFLQVAPGGEALNVNALDEVPDSSWFQNRLGRQLYTPEQLAVGPCGDDLDPAADGTWVIDQGKTNGATPGFRVRTPDGDKYLLKSDVSGAAERASAASALGVRFYHAAGFNTACDSVVYFDPKILELKPGLTITDNSGVARPFDQAALDALLKAAARDGERVRMQSSKWLSGVPLGPFRYEGTRHDDPNDVIPHEDRRELRGGRLLAAWINHFDTREQNTMAVWEAADPKRPTSSPGMVRHYYLDISDALGSTWSTDGISRRLGKSYYFDGKDVAIDFVTFGMLKRPWEYSEREPGVPLFGYFRAEDFVPEQWKGGYQNPAFLRMTEHDGAWMARIIARFRDEDVAAIVATGKFTEPAHERALLKILLGRRDAILRRYLTRLSPLTDVRANARGVCAVDLARRTGIAGHFAYRAWLGGEGSSSKAQPLAVQAHADANVCVQIPRTAGEGGVPDDDASRYRVVRIDNGVAKGPLEVHLYDLGPARGLRVVGLVRPTS